MTYALTLLLVFAVLAVVGFFQVKRFVRTTELGGYLGVATAMTVFYLLSAMVVLLLHFLLQAFTQ